MIKFNLHTYAEYFLVDLVTNKPLGKNFPFTSISVPIIVSQTKKNEGGN